MIWDNCTAQESNTVESVQPEAARIITGPSKGTSDKLYHVLGGNHYVIIIKLVNEF